MKNWYLSIFCLFLFQSLKAMNAPPQGTPGVHVIPYAPLPPPPPVVQLPAVIARYQVPLNELPCTPSTLRKLGCSVAVGFTTIFASLSFLPQNGSSISLPAAALVAAGLGATSAALTFGGMAYHTYLRRNQWRRDHIPEEQV